MAIEKLKLSTLAQIDDGRIREAFEQALRRCEADCADRPALEEARRVVLTATLTPCLGDDATMESCDVQFQIVDQIPRRRSKVYNMKADESGLYFNELSPDDIRQLTLDEPRGPRSAKDVG